MDERWLNAKEIAAYIGTSVGTVQVWCLTGDLPHVRLGGGRDIRTKASLLDEWMTKGEAHGRDGVQRLRKPRAVPKKRTM
jgi:excisionase family DNA binding protein